jgi:hypothetical protein
MENRLAREVKSYRMHLFDSLLFLGLTAEYLEYVYFCRCQNVETNCTTRNEILKLLYIIFHKPSR